jgi:outer membrane protein assembly factor BamB
VFLEKNMRTEHFFIDFIVIIMVFMASASYYSPAGAADWPNWRGPNHNGISEEGDWTTSWPAEGPKILWKKSIGTGFASMAVSDGQVYATGNIDDNDILYCLEAGTGKEIWKKSYPCPLYKKNHEGGPAATPTVHDGAVYVFSKDGDVLRFNATDGQIVWHTKLVKDKGFKYPTWYFSSSPLIVDDLVILNAGKGVALNRSDGSVVWENGKGPGGYASAVPFMMGDQECIALFGKSELIGLFASTGKIMWELPWKTSYDINGADPIIKGDQIFISSGYNKGCALLKMESSRVKELWKSKNMSNHFNSCVLWQGYVYGFNGQAGGRGELACVDWNTGEQKWAQKGMGTGSVMLADSKLIILGERGKLVIANALPEGYEQLAEAQILRGKCWTVPVLANGRIYARNAVGDLVCVDVRQSDSTIMSKK